MLCVAEVPTAWGVPIQSDVTAPGGYVTACGVVNLHTARAPGLTIPPFVPSQADEVIE